jgi:hypothetical protein
METMSEQGTQAPEAGLPEADPRSGGRSMSPAAERALAEAEARRNAAACEPAPREIDGRGGLEPVRYGDWEVRGLAADF